jgi:hypothetical protein
VNGISRAVCGASSISGPRGIEYSVSLECGHYRIVTMKSRRERVPKKMLCKKCLIEKRRAALEG